MPEVITKPKRKLRPKVLHGTSLRNARGQYTWRGETYPSVTTIIKVLDKPALLPWAKKMVAEFVADHTRRFDNGSLAAADYLSLMRSADRLKKEPFDYAEQKRETGTVVHGLVERFASGQAVMLSAYPDDQRVLAECQLDWLKTRKPDIEHIEFPIFNKQFQYAGTSDFLCTIEGERLIVDWKTGEPWPEEALQMAAYSACEFIADTRRDREVPLGRIDGCLVVHLSPDGWTECRWPISEALTAFLAAAVVYRWKRTNPKPEVRK